jgi:hypothetical protein
MRLVWAALVAWAILLTAGVITLFDNVAIQRATQAEISYIRQQQAANARTIEFLTDQYFEMRMQQRRGNK